MKTLYSLILCTVLVPLWAVAKSDGVGNGGDYLKCDPDSGRPPSQLVDYYEGEEDGLKIDLGSSDLSVREKVKYVLGHYSKLDLTRAQAYQAEANKILDDLDRVGHLISQKTEPQLREINDLTRVVEFSKRIWPVGDIGVLSVPERCNVLQLAAQVDPEVQLVKKKPYSINVIFWSSVDKDTRAGLILHEIGYHENMANGHINSTLTRQFNALISSTKIRTMTSAEYYFTVRKMGFKTMDYQGVPIDLREGMLPSFYPTTWQLERAYLASGGSIRIPGFEGVGRGQIRFHPNGQLKFAEYRDPITLTLPRGSLEVISVQLREDGTLEAAQVTNLRSWKYRNTIITTLRLAWADSSVVKILYFDKVGDITQLPSLYSDNLDSSSMAFVGGKYRKIKTFWEQGCVGSPKDYFAEGEFVFSEPEVITTALGMLTVRQINLDCNGNFTDVDLTEPVVLTMPDKSQRSVIRFEMKSGVIFYAEFSDPYLIKNLPVGEELKVRAAFYDEKNQASKVWLQGGQFNCADRGFWGRYSAGNDCSNEPLSRFRK